MRVLRNSYVSLLAWGILLAGTSSLTSCAEDEVINNYGNKEDGAGISFSLSKDNNVWEADSRAAQPKQNFVLRSEDSADTLCVSAQTEYGISDALQADSRGALVTNKDNVLNFGVTSYFYKSTEETANPAFYFMKNEEVEDGKTTNKVYYWPPSNNELSFVAVAPYHALTLPDSPTASATLSYTVPTDVTKHEDLMVAKTARINNGTNGAAVPLAFNHILTAVQFAIGDTPEGSITSISVSGDMIQGGTYTINSGEWTAKNTAAATYTISEATTGYGVTTETINEKTIVSEKIITIPQDIAANTLTLTVVFNDASAGERILSASIPATTWAKGTTTTYTISISEAYTLEFIKEVDGHPLQDAHYVMDEVTIHVDPKLTSGWTVTSSDATVTLNTSKTDLQTKGYWTEYKYTGDDRTLRTNVISGTTTGNIPIYVFWPENTTDKNRQVKLTLTATGTNITDTYTLEQLCPSWYSNTNGNYGCERLEESKNIWGLSWGSNYTVKYNLTKCSNSDREAISRQIRWTKLLGTILPDWFTEDYSYIDHDYSGGILGGLFSKTDYVTINFGDLMADGSANNIAISPTDGTANTKALYEFAGLSQVADIMAQLNGLSGISVSTTGTGSLDVVDYAAEDCAKLNKFTKQIADNEDLAVISSYSWFLPAKSEVTGIIDNTYKLEGDYWTSSAATSTDDTQNYSSKAWKYTYGSTIVYALDERGNENKVRCVRKKPTTTTTN